MTKLERYLEQLQQTEQMSAAGIGFAIDSPHTRKRTLPQAQKAGIVVADPKKSKKKLKVVSNN
jgi:hypothetical protein